MSIEGDVVVVFVTAPQGKGKEIARAILEKRLAACINIVSVQSMYWWKGRVEEDKEELLIIKTRASLVEKLVEEIRKVHPYEVPEIIALPVVAGFAGYVRWVREEARGG